MVITSSELECRTPSLSNQPRPPAGKPLSANPQTVVSWLAAADPASLALLAPGRTPLSYGALLELVEDVAGRLHAAGVGRGDRVAIVLANGPEMTAAFLAVCAVATSAPLNPAYRAAEFEHYLDDLRPKAIILPAGEDTAAREVARSRGIRIVELRPLVDEPAGRFELDLPAAGAATGPGWAQPGDVALVLHTSGTTARPKMVPLSQSNLYHSAANIRDTLRLQASDRCLSVMPMFHIHGLIGATLSSIAAGASLVCPPGFIAPKFFDWLDQMEPTWYTAVPTMHQAILGRAAAHREIVARRPLRFIRSSSAPLPPSVMAELERVFEAPVIESYGMTEAAHQMASNPLPPAERKPGSVGLAAGPRIAVHDERGQPVPPGQVGHVVICGPSVTAGYEANPEANASSFTGGWFDTGDLGRLDGDGYLFLAGRTKEIINRGGEKISPREVDEALLEHPAVAQALTFAVPDRRLGEEIGAAVVLRDGAPLVSDLELADFVAAKLADFKVPRHIVFLKEIPKGPTGKPQRIGLAQVLGLTQAAPAKPASRLAAPKEATPTEAWLLGLFRDVLSILSPTPEDNFFDLGGDSILATQLAARIRNTRGRHLPPLRVFQLKTATAIAAYLDNMAGHPEADCAAAAIPAGPPTGSPALSFAQERIWFLAAYEEEPIAYVAPVLYRLTGALDIAAFNRALNAIVARHEVLRTSVISGGAALKAYLRPLAPIEVEVVDVSHIADAGERERQARQAVEAQSRKGIDLSREAAYRMFLVRSSGEEHLALLQKHHFASDGWSTHVFWRELTAFYEAFQRGAEPALAPLPIQYRDYAAWQRQGAGEEAMRRQLDFWVQALSGKVAPLELPTDRPRPSRQTFRGARISQRLPRPLSAAVKAAARQQDCTLFMILLAAWEVLLFRYSGETNFCIGTPVAGRTHIETEPLIGIFLNTLPQPVDLSGAPTFRQLLARVRQSALDAYANQDVPLDRVIEAVRPERSLARSPLFQVMFQLRNYAPALPGLSGVAVEELAIEHGVALFDLIMEAAEREDGIECFLNYNSGLFEPETAGRILRHYANLLEAATQDPDQPIAKLGFLSAQERHTMLVEWNQTAVAWPGPACVHQRIEEQAARTPGALAVTCANRSLTYGQLNQRANQLARYLRKRGARAGAHVGLCVDRSLDMVAGLLGIMKSGAAYLPLDPAYPAAWREGVLADAGTTLLVTDETFQDQALALEETANLDEPPVVGPRDIVYTIYTSGSTGRPKGVEVSHGALVNALECCRREPGFTSEDVFLAVSSISFDIAASELLLPLLAGGRVWIASRAVAADGVALAKLIAHSSASVLQATPATFRMLVDSGWPGCPGLEAWAGGETLSRDLANQLLDRCGAVWNLYGPTETTIWSAFSQVRRGEGAVPIGRPAANTGLYVLDSHRQPVPVNVPGELYIGGAGLANGYLKRPELTAASFIASPIPEAGDGRLYKTGDLVRQTPNGELVYLQRMDNQVKLRGYRIELGEVESALNRHPSVKAAVAMVREDTPGYASLVAYLLPHPEQAPGADELRFFLRDSLPAHMVPSAFVVLDEFPLTSNAKIDRRKLPPPPQIPAASGHGRGSGREWDAMAREIARIWEDVLGLSNVGLHDDFFALGGHSLLAVRLIFKINAAFNAGLPLAVLFEAPTVGQLAEVVRRGTAGKFRSSLVPIKPHGSRPPIFLVSRFSALGYRGLVEHLDPEQPLYALVPPGPDNGATPIDSMEGLAVHYLREIRRIQPSGPYVIGGYSLGAFPAYEIACQLESQGERVALVFLIDAGAHTLPSYRAMLPMHTLWKSRLVHWAGALNYHAQVMWRQSASQRRHHIQDLISRKKRAMRRLLMEFDTDQTMPQVRQVVEQANKAALHSYLPKPYSGRVVLARSAKTFSGFDLKRQGWVEFAPNLETHEIPDSDHLELMNEPHVARLAEILTRSIEKAGLSSGAM